MATLINKQTENSSNKEMTVPDGITRNCVSGTDCVNENLSEFSSSGINVSFQNLSENIISLEETLPDSLLKRSSLNLRSSFDKTAQESLHASPNVIEQVIKTTCKDQDYEPLLMEVDEISDDGFRSDDDVDSEATSTTDEEANEVQPTLDEKSQIELETDIRQKDYNKRSSVRDPTADVSITLMTAYTPATAKAILNKKSKLKVNDCWKKIAPPIKRPTRAVNKDARISTHVLSTDSADYLVYLKKENISKKDQTTKNAKTLFTKQIRLAGNDSFYTHSLLQNKTTYIKTEVIHVSKPSMSALPRPELTTPAFNLENDSPGHYRALNPIVFPSTASLNAGIRNSLASSSMTKTRTNTNNSSVLLSTTSAAIHTSVSLNKEASKSNTKMTYTTATTARMTPLIQIQIPSTVSNTTDKKLTPRYKLEKETIHQQHIISTANTNSKPYIIPIKVSRSLLSCTSTAITSATSILQTGGKMHVMPEKLFTVTSEATNRTPTILYVTDNDYPGQNITPTETPLLLANKQDSTCLSTASCVQTTTVMLRKKSMKPTDVKSSSSFLTNQKLVHVQSLSQSCPSSKQGLNSSDTLVRIQLPKNKKVTGLRTLQNLQEGSTISSKDVKYRTIKYFDNESGLYKKDNLISILPTKTPNNSIVANSKTKTSTCTASSMKNNCLTLSTKEITPLVVKSSVSKGNKSFETILPITNTISNQHMNSTASDKWGKEKPESQDFLSQTVSQNVQIVHTDRLSNSAVTKSNQIQVPERASPVFTNVRTVLCSGTDNVKRALKSRLNGNNENQHKQTLIKSDSENVTSVSLSSDTYSKGTISNENDSGIIIESAYSLCNEMNDMFLKVGSNVEHCNLPGTAYNLKLSEDAQKDTGLRKPCFVVLQKVKKLKNKLVISRCSKACRQHYVKHLCQLVSENVKEQTTPFSNGQMIQTKPFESKKDIQSHKSVKNAEGQMCTVGRSLVDKVVLHHNTQSTPLPTSNYDVDDTVSPTTKSKSLNDISVSSQVNSDTGNMNMEDHAPVSSCSLIVQNGVKAINHSENSTDKLINKEGTVQRGQIHTEPVSSVYLLRTSEESTAPLVSMAVKYEPETIGYADDKYSFASLKEKRYPSAFGVAQNYGPSPTKVPRISDNMHLTEDKSQRIKHLRNKIKEHKMALDEIKLKRKLEH